ncbi:MAG TPA: hypothetical protein VF109_04235 [Mycobacteriales bacterium]
MPLGVRSILSVVTLTAALAAGPAIGFAGGPAVAGGPAAAFAGGVSPARAAPGTAAPATHCVLAAGARAATCYATFPAAIAAATGGRVRAPASAAAAASDARFAAALDDPSVTAASVVVGIEYTNANYSGSTLTLSAPGRCDDSNDADYWYATLPAGWNDVISSFRSYSNCAQQLFRNTYFQGGALTGILTNTPYVGAPANDQASSITAN